MSNAVDGQQSSTVARPTGINRLLASTAVSLIGQGAVAAAAPLLAASLTSSPLAVASVTAARSAASLIVGLPAGAYVDRWARRSTMIGADLIRSIVLIGLALMVAAGWATIPLVIVCVFVIASAGCFFDPAAQAAIPALVGREDTRALTRANGWLWGLDVFGRSLLGPPLGAALFVVAAWFPFGLNTATFGASALLLIGVSRLPAPAREGPPTCLRADIAEGLRYLLGHAQLRWLALGMSAYNFGYNVAYATLVLYVTRTLGLRDIAFGLLLAVLAVGGVVGGWLGPVIARRVPALRIYAFALLIQALAWFSFFAVHAVVVSAAGLLAVGIASTTVTIAGGTARQRLTPDALLGRVGAGTRVVGIGSAAIGALLGGTLAGVWSLTTPFLVAAAFLTAASIAFGLGSRGLPRPE